MRNKIVKKLRKKYKVAVDSGALSKEAVYKDEVIPRQRYIGLTPDPKHKGTFSPVVEEYEELVYRQLAPECLKFQVKFEKLFYKGKVHAR